MVVVYGCSVLCNSVVRVWVHVCVCVVRVHLGTRVGHLVVGTCVWGGGICVHGKVVVIPLRLLCQLCCHTECVAVGVSLPWERPVKW